MTRVIKKRSTKAGLTPGTLVHIGEKKTERAEIGLIHYSDRELREVRCKTIDEAASGRQAPGVTWINVDGLHQLEVLEKTGELFGVHPLVLEDIANTDQRPKMEDFERYLYIVLKMIHYDGRRKQIDAEQVSLVLGSDFVLSFQEKKGDVFGPVRERIQASKGRIRKAGPDYLAYALVDAVVDSYFAVLEQLGEEIDSLQEKLVSQPAPATLRLIHELKRETLLLRRAVWPLRELIGGLERLDSPLITDATRFYLRDVHDHAIHVLDTVETYREMLSGMLDIYLSGVSVRTNEVMKFLTLIATIFIPLTFIAGIYGMNFKYMPELEWRWGYLLTWLIMLAVVGCLLLFFKKKGWF